MQTFIDAAALLPTRHIWLGHGGRQRRGTCRFSRVHARGNVVEASIYRTLQCVFPAIFWFFYCGATAPLFV